MSGPLIGTPVHKLSNFCSAFGPGVHWRRATRGWRMTLDQLQIFIAVAEREHVTRAAASLGLAPPSVSAAVASLEREFGTKLFHRVGRGIVVTEGGKLLLDEARALVNRADALKLAMREFTGLARGRLQIKASQTIASHFLPPR